jgi:hypothetical protein
MRRRRGVADQAGGDCQQGAQGVGGGLGQPRVVVEGEQPEPGEQVRGDRDGDAPGLVEREVVRRQPFQAEVFGTFDDGFHLGVVTVERVQFR